MGQEFGVAMHAMDTNTTEESLTEAVTKYDERATRAEANMAEMVAKFEERFAMLFMTTQQPQKYTPPPPQYLENYQPMQTAYFTTPPPLFIPPPATIHVPSPQQLPPYQEYNAGKKISKGQGTRSQGGSANHWQRDQPYGGNGRGGKIPENPNYYNQPQEGSGRNPAATQWNHGGRGKGQRKQPVAPRRGRTMWGDKATSSKHTESKPQLTILLLLRI